MTTAPIENTSDGTWYTSFEGWPTRSHKRWRVGGEVPPIAFGSWWAGSMDGADQATHSFSEGNDLHQDLGCGNERCGSSPEP